VESLLPWQQHTTCNPLLYSRDLYHPPCLLSCLPRLASTVIVGAYSHSPHDRWHLAAAFVTAGTYKFFVQPTTQIDVNRTLDLPSNYGNVGDYTLTVDYPGTPAVPPPDCNPLTNCNPKGICTSDCSCTTVANAPTCICNAAQGLRRAILAGKPACIWNLLQPTSGPALRWSLLTNIGYFSAHARSLVKLPWLSTGCPAAGKTVVTSAILLNPAIPRPVGG
jgi:hypothetical protein